MYDPTNPYANLGETPLPDDWHTMTQEEREQYMASRAAGGCLSLAVALLIGLAVCLIFGSCSPVKFIEVERVTHDTLRQVTLHRDSIYIHDSTSTAQYQQGDTLYVYQTRWRDRWHYQMHVDTLRVVRIDSIPYPVEVVKEVPRQRSDLEGGLMGVGIAALVCLFLFIVAKVKKYLPGM